MQWCATWTSPNVWCLSRTKALSLRDVLLSCGGSGVSKATYIAVHVYYAMSLFRCKFDPSSAHARFTLAVAFQKHVFVGVHCLSTAAMLVNCHFRLSLSSHGTRPSLAKLTLWPRQYWRTELSLLAHLAKLRGTENFPLRLNFTDAWRNAQWGGGRDLLLPSWDCSANVPDHQHLLFQQGDLPQGVDLQCFWRKALTTIKLVFMLALQLHMSTWGWNRYCFSVSILRQSACCPWICLIPMSWSF